MAMRNKIKQFIEEQGITVYEFRKRTGIANKTAYDLVNRPEQYPNREVMDKICSTFRIQPGAIIEWVDEDIEPIDSTPESEQPIAPSRRRKAAIPAKEKQEFKPGQMVRNPAGWRGWINKLLEDGRAVVDWENQVNGDVIPLHLLSTAE